VGAEAYAAAGGIIMRDLFSEDDGGWFQDMTILERLVGERLTALASEIKAEGWAWVEAAPDFPYGHTNGMRQITGEPCPHTDAEEHERHSLLAEIDRILGAYGEGEDLTHADDRRVREIEARLEVLDTRPVVYDPVEMARAGAFISIAMDGTAHVQRGFVRAEDEPRADAPEPNPAEPGPAPETPEAPADPVPETPVPLPPTAESEPEDEGLRPLSDRLVSDLTAFRTLALRESLGRNPDTAFLALLHALCLSTFQPWAPESCLELVMRSATLNIQPPELAESAAAKAFDARHAEWAERLPTDPADLWGTLAAMSGEDRMALLAHCVSRSVHAVVDPWNRVPGRLRHADTLARATGLDITAAGWQANAETYLNRVPKARILEAVREAKGERPAARIEHLRKGEMAKAAARLLEGTGWLPEPLRLPEPAPEVADEESPAVAAA
jgi:ParB family chromosome partitioning protein